IRGIPENIAPILSKLTSQQQIEQIQIIDSQTQQPLRGTWYIHTKNLPLLEQIENNEWTGRTTFLSPFDNLIYERTRIEQLFNFKYRLEIYVPEKDRQYGPYSLPILFGDQLMGRIDTKLNRETNHLEIRAIHTEPNAQLTQKVIKAIQSTLNEFATFLKAEHIQHFIITPKI
ncbi:MAG: DNA glycosylase AlkZ-like family protein, partial [Promethearchaeota archaeon]